MSKIIKRLGLLMLLNIAIMYTAIVTSAIDSIMGIGYFAFIVACSSVALLWGVIYLLWKRGAYRFLSKALEKFDE